MEKSATYSPDSFCPKCGGKQFEIAALNLSNSKYSPWVIRCAAENCKIVLGVVPAAELAKHAQSPF